MCISFKGDCYLTFIVRFEHDVVVVSEVAQDVDMSKEKTSGKGGSEDSMDSYDMGCKNGELDQVSSLNPAAGNTAPMIGNINSPSVSMASVSSGKII